jgi:quercetin dioxygenase-like cupin family protein
MAKGLVVTADKGSTFDIAPGADVRVVNGAEHGLGEIAFVITDFPPGVDAGEHRHPFATVSLVVEGSGVFTVEGVEFAASVGDIIAVPAGAWHTYRNNGESSLRVVNIDVGNGTHVAEVPSPKPG